MRTILPKGGWIVIALVAATAAGCAPKTTYTNAKKMSREDAAIDVLDCRKAQLLKYKAARQNRPDSTSRETRLAALKAGREAWDRCLRSRGWQKKT